LAYEGKKWDIEEGKKKAQAPRPVQRTASRAKPSTPAIGEGNHPEKKQAHGCGRDMFELGGETTDGERRTLGKARAEVKTQEETEIQKMRNKPNLGKK